MFSKQIENFDFMPRKDWRGKPSGGGKREIVSRSLVVVAAIFALVGYAGAPVWAQSAEDLSKEYTRAAMEQALQTRQQYALYGIHFDTDKATIQPGAEPLLDDIATALNNFPDWNLRIIGHTDSTGDPTANMVLSQARADAIKAALVERGLNADRLLSAGFGQERPVASNETAEGKALNRRVELTRFTDSAEAKQLLKGMSDYVAAQNAISFGYDADFEVVTDEGQKLGLASSGSVVLRRPDKLRSARSGGFADVEAVFDGTTLTLLAKNANKYTQIAIPGTVDGLADALRDKYGLPLPAADLLMSNPYDALMDGVYDSKDLGSGVVNGVECDSLAFRKDDVDFQIWVAQGSQPYPCRMVITSRIVSGGPQYSVQVRDWATEDGVVFDDFAFKNPTNAEKIDVNDLRGSLGDMPENFVKGDGK